MNAIRKLKVAGIQVESRNFAVMENLRRAEVQVSIAVARGAELVLCPEFLASGYIYDRSLWDVAEPQDGPTERWLSRIALQHRLHIGASYLEACGEEFFNTFTLMKPDGTVAGRVRKESLPGFEGWYFSSSSTSKIIETEIGRVGIGICWDNNTARFLRRIAEGQVDILLMPHSAPAISLGPLKLVGDRGRDMLRGVAGFYASEFGVPAVMTNKAAGEDVWSPIPCLPLFKLRFHYLGQSTICNGDGQVCDQLGEQEGIVFAEVTLDFKQKRQPARLPNRYWSRPPSLFPRMSAGLFRVLEWTGQAAYKFSQRRRLAARRAKTKWQTEELTKSEV